MLYKQAALPYTVPHSLCHAGSREKKRAADEVVGAGGGNQFILTYSVPSSYMLPPEMGIIEPDEL